MFGSKFNRITGTVLICFGILVYEVLSARLLTVTLSGPLAIFAIAFAMLGMGAAASIMSLSGWPRANSGNNRELGLLALILGIAYPVCLFLLATASEHSNSTLEAAMSAGGFSGLIDSLRANLMLRLIWVSAVLMIPYFIFGIFIAALFRSTSNEEYHQYYAADLFGASLGCLAFVLVVDRFGYSGGLFLILMSTFMGAAAFSRVHSLKAVLAPAVLAVIALIVIANPGSVALLEPQPPMNQLARNYEKNYTVDQQWHVWNAHSRIAHLKLTQPGLGYSGDVFAHEDGAGWAIAPGKRKNPNVSTDRLYQYLTSSHQLSRLTTMYQPKKVLVLFAGVGADMATIDRNCEGKCEITGVEINRHMVEYALANNVSGVAELLDKPNVELVIAEAREFLGRDTSRYDAILLSWWGAGTSQYLGTSGGLAQYMYTTEAFVSLIEHLTPDGVLVLYNGNKAQILLNFRQIYQEQGWTGLEEQVVVLGVKNTTPNYLEMIDTKKLIVKPSGFDDQELATLRETTSSLNYQVLLAPDYVDPGYRIYREIMSTQTLGDINSVLIRDNNMELSIVRDDRPFLEHFIPASFYLDFHKWIALDIESEQWGFVRLIALFTAFLGVVACIIVIGPLTLRAGPEFSPRNFANLAYFLSLGAGFILIEIALVRKFGLILGHPSYSIAVVLAAMISSTGLGSLTTRRMFETYGLTIRRTAIGIVIYVLAGTALYNWLVSDIVALPIVVKVIIVLCSLFPLGFLMGQMFPQGLARVSRDDTRLVPWAWAINGTVSTVGVGIADLLSHPMGFNAILYIGAAFYAILIFLPIYGQADSKA